MEEGRAARAGCETAGVVMPYLHQAPWGRLVFDLGVAAFAAGELFQATRRRSGDPRLGIRGEVGFRVAFFAAILTLPLATTIAPRASLDGATVFILGAVVGWLGLFLRWWSFATLGDYFTTVVKASADQPVVSRGPYRVLRHPGYAGLLAAFLGCGLMVGNWVGAAASFLVISVALVHRLLREEQVMVDALGDEYLEFARQRARLVPFLW